MRVRYLLFAAVSLLLAASTVHADGVADLQGFYDKVDSLSAHFEQVQTDDRGNTLQQAGGIFLLARPDSFRWEYDTPYQQIIVSDGETFEFYDVDLAQVTIRDIDATLRATPALLLTGGTELEDAFNVSAAGSRAGLTWVRLTPRTDDTDFKEVRLGLNEQIPAVMELDDNLGQTTRIRFSDVQVNSDPAASRFSLDIPDDVEVVDGRSLNSSGGGQR